MQDKGLAQVIVIAEGYDNVKELNNLLGEDDYSNYKNIIFATDTKSAGKKYICRVTVKAKKTNTRRSTACIKNV